MLSVDGKVYQADSSKVRTFFESSYEKVNNIVVWIVEPARSLLTWPAFHTIPRFFVLRI